MNPIYRFFIQRASANLLDPGMAVNGYRLNVSNGKLVSANAKTSDYMPVVPGDEYVTKYNAGAAASMAYIAFYDAAYTFISGSANVLSATAPTGAAFARVSFVAGVDLSEWQFAESSVAFSTFVSSRVYPVYKDDVSIDYALSDGEEFYRGFLSGKLTFQADDYACINSAAFDKKFDFEIKISYDGGANWFAYWRGKFYKTDCEFNDDDKTVIVTPELEDRYCNVLAGLEKEYDLIKLAPEIVKVQMDKRPMLQYYLMGEGIVGCFLSGMWWEQECETSGVTEQRLWDDGFARIVDKITGAFTQGAGGSPALPELMEFHRPLVWPDDTWSMSGGGFDFVCTHVSGDTYSFAIRYTGTLTNLWIGYADRNMPFPDGYEVTLSPVSGTTATGNVTVRIDWVDVWARIVTDKETENTIALTADDVVPDMRNYHYAVRVDSGTFGQTVAISALFSSTPTEWGLYEPGKYYRIPSTLYPDSFYPLCRNSWGAISLWIDGTQIPAGVDESFRKSLTLRDAYPIASVISVLLGQFAPGITHQGTTDYSRFLYSENDPLTGESHHLFITPKSNILTAGYDQPAQQAKITLRMVLDMLRDCYRCFWFIDEQNRFRVEHIEFFRRGGSYSVYPSVGIDLTQEIVSRSGKPWAFARNQYKFDKPEMAERYQFGWMDDVTSQFEGQPIDIVSGYVQPGNTENIVPKQFTSDVDYMLLNPSACSKDGFALLSAIFDGTIYGKYLNRTGVEITNAAWDISPYIKVNAGDSLEWFTGADSNVGYLIVYNSSKQYLDYWTPNVGSSRTVTLGANSAYVRISYASGNSAAYANLNGDRIFDASDPKYKLPYITYQESKLQNGQLCWPYLQIYYVWDMPARTYKIGPTQYTSVGVKKLKTQALKFPVWKDPNLYELVKTELGDGTIQKLSINLCSRIANATLKYSYDTQ